MATGKKPRTRRQAATAQCVADDNGSLGALPDRSKATFHGLAFRGSRDVSSNDRAVASIEARSHPDDDELWSFKAVVAKTGLSRSSIYGYVARGIFPRQRHIGPRRVAWLASEVRAWIASRPS